MVGASGGLNIIPAVVQVFLNHFVLGMEPLAAVRHPRVFHKVILHCHYFCMDFLVETYCFVVIVIPLFAQNNYFNKPR